MGVDGESGAADAAGGDPVDDGSKLEREQSSGTAGPPSSYANSHAIPASGWASAAVRPPPGAAPAAPPAAEGEAAGSSPRTAPAAPERKKGAKLPAGHKYTFFVGPGNNSELVRQTLERRPWWVLGKEDDPELNLKWLQVRSSSDGDRNAFPATGVGRSELAAMSR